MKSFTLSAPSTALGGGGGATTSSSRPSTSFTLSRPSTSRSNQQHQQLTDQQRVDSFASELSRLCNPGTSSHVASASAAGARDRSSYVLLRRAEHAAIHRAMFAATDSNLAPSLWKSLLQLLQTETRSAEILANSLSLLLLCAGKFNSEQVMREFIACRKDTDTSSSLPHSSAASSSSSSSTTSAASTTSSSYDQVLWNRVWNWDIDTTSNSRPRVADSLAAILTPLLLSVHPTKQQLSSVLLKKGSARGVAALEKLWAVGLELILSLLQAPPAAQNLPSANDSLVLLARVQLHSFSFFEAVTTFSSVQLQQAPFVSSNQLSIWRMIEVAFTLFFIHEQSTTTKASTTTNSAVQASVTESKQIGAFSAFQKDSVLWKLLTVCFHEICRARSCSCCSSSGLSSSASFHSSAFTAASAIDPFVISSKQSSSPYISLSTLMLRYLKALVDDPSQASSSQLVWDKLPIIQVFLFHCLIFHSKNSSANPSQIALDAEYLLTRHYFDSKNILKLLPLLVSNEASGSLDFTPSVSIYLPKVQEDFLASLQCQHMSYRRDGLKYGININALSSFKQSTPSVPASSSSFNAIEANLHSVCLIRMIINLMKKYLLLALDLSQSTTATTSATSTSTVRVVRDIQGWKVAQQITMNWIRLLQGLMQQRPSSDQDECIPDLIILIQSSILEFYLWNSKVTLRMKELFDTAHEMARDSSRMPVEQPTSFDCADVLYGLGARILLCLVDSITSSLPSLDAKESSSLSAQSSASTHNPFGALLGEYISCLVQDLRSIITDAKTARLTENNTDQDGSPIRQLQISDIFDMTYRSSQTAPPRVRKAAAYQPILQQLLGFLQSLLPRLSFNLATTGTSPLSVAVPSNAATIATPTLIGSTSGTAGMLVSQPLTPRAPAAVATAPLQSPTRLRRPMSSHSHLSSASSLPLSPSGVSRSSAPRAPSYSPPTSAGSAVPPLGGLGAAFSPRPPSASSSLGATTIRNVPPLSGGVANGSMSARSSNSGSKHRQYKPAATVAAVSLAPLPPSSAATAPMPPRAAPPPSSSPRAVTASALKPLLGTLAGSSAPVSKSK